MRYDYLVVGAGFAGSVCAERLASAGKTVLLIDERPHLGGNAYDEVNEHGILVHRYGAHVFHCNSQDVVNYLSRFTSWRPYRHKVLSKTDGRMVPMPINQTTLKAFGGDVAAAKRALIEPYTRKQWGEWAESLSPSVLARIRTRDNDDDGYFTDTYQQMPVDGYTALFQRMVKHDRITVQLSSSYKNIAPSVEAGHVIWTGPVDRYFDYSEGRLPYRSATFTHTTLKKPQAQPVGVVNYPSPKCGYTRVTEFKHLTGQTHPYTTITREYPQATGEPYWPIPTHETAALAKRYRERAAETPGVSFLGRLGTYRYLDMAPVVKQALTLTTQLLRKEAV